MALWCCFDANSSRCGARGAAGPQCAGHAPSPPAATDTSGLGSWMPGSASCGDSSGSTDDGHGGEINIQGSGWAGVGCNPAGDVTRLVLDEQHNHQFADLTGTLSALSGVAASLTSLTYLNLHKTAITGSLTWPTLPTCSN